MGRYRTVNVEVEVCMSDFDTEDLVEELQSRRTDAPNGADQSGAYAAIYLALKFGQEDRALALTRALICDVLGVTL